MPAGRHPRGHGGCPKRRGGRRGTLGYHYLRLLHAALPGPEALAIVRELGYDTPFIVVSGKVGEDLAVEIMKAGAQDYITKENMARLNPAIERELREAGVRRERLQAREALDRSEERFRRLVEQAADAMFVHDLEAGL